MKNYKTVRLCDTEWFNNDPIYRKIYEILAIEDRLPSPCDIRIISEDISNYVSPTTLGFTYKEDKIIWFRHIPPELDVFAHELIHVTRKESNLHEEIYAYNLAIFIVFLAENNIVPKVNPLRLFEDITIDELAKVICEETNICYDNPRETIKEFFSISGVIPLFFEIKASEDDKITFDFRANISDRDITIYTLTELISIVDFDSLSRSIIFRLLKIAEEKSK